MAKISAAELKKATMLLTKTKMSLLTGAMRTAALEIIPNWSPLEIYIQRERGDLTFSLMAGKVQ